jgi:hypothetical protein
MELTSIPYGELSRFVFPRLAFARPKILSSEKVHNRCLADLICRKFSAGSDQIQFKGIKLHSCYLVIHLQSFPPQRFSHEK